ncbi:MAG: hypothetical protein EZS28_014460 [Streblomastix strix]|uniref:Uncharacterized protein n=1 Tax=Streblomastix strix TaxID=222440 RepID=A0A5J4W684_9EUKA|nr:MAG: hypothetical protein EZS28_014460 [Streblomastix strix]
MKESNCEFESLTTHIIESNIESKQFATTYCASILAVLGLLHVILDRAREAKREGREYGGSFMIYGEKEIEQEYNEISLRRKLYQIN